MQGARFEIRRGRTGLFRFVLIAPNSETVATSQHYPTKAICKKGIKAVCACFGTDPAHAGTPTIVDTTLR